MGEVVRYCRDCAHYYDTFHWDNYEIIHEWGCMLYKDSGGNEYLQACDQYIEKEKENAGNM